VVSPSSSTTRATTIRPGWRRSERALGLLEGGDALLYASGMGAVTNVLLSFGSKGSTVAIAHDAYFGTSKLLGLLAPWGIEYVEVRPDRNRHPDADIVWVEAPANPTLSQPDWEAVRAHRGLVVATRRSRRRCTCEPSTRGADVVRALGDEVPDGAP